MEHNAVQLQESAKLRGVEASAIHSELRSTQEELQSQELAAFRSVRPSWSSPIHADEPSCCSLPDGSAASAGCLEHGQDATRGGFEIGTHQAEITGGAGLG